MRHLSFFDALANCTEQDLDCPGLTSGLLVLRTFDAWCTDGPAVLSNDEQFLANIRRTIRTIPDSDLPLRHLLTEALSVLVNADAHDTALVCGPFFGYARYLEERNFLALASDVWATFAEALDPALGRSDDAQAAGTAYLRHGIIAQRTGDLDAAKTSYTRAHALGKQISDMRLMLMSRMWHAWLSVVRGDLSAGDAELNRVLVEAEILGEPYVVTYTHRLRGATLHQGGRFVDAFCNYYHAHVQTQETLEREKILGSLASCAADAGFREISGHMYWALAQSAQTTLARVYALVNLMDLAIMDDDVAAFERARVALARYPAVELPVELSLYRDLYAADAMAQFQGTPDVLPMYQALSTRARRAGIYQVEHLALTRAERATALIEARSHEPLLPCIAPTPIPDVLVPIVASVEEICVLALADSAETATERAGYSSLSSHPTRDTHEWTGNA